MNDQPDHEPTDRPTDLDVVVDDVGGTDADRALDAELSRRLQSTAGASGTDDLAGVLSAVKERGLRRRRRSRARRTALAAAAVVVVAAAGVVVHERTTPPPLRPATGTVLPLRPDAPALAPADQQRLESLQLPQSRLARGEDLGYWNTPISAWAAPVDCAEAAVRWGLEIPVLPGLDTEPYRQVCATDDQQAFTEGSFAAGPTGAVSSLYRFYLPRGTDLSRVTRATAAAAGVSWTRIAPVSDQQPVTPRESAADVAAGTTTVSRTRGDLALVTRGFRGDTGVSWSERDGDASFSASAEIAADPVAAVRATLDPHPCDGAFSISLGASSGGALTAKGALQSWLDGDDADGYPAGAGPQGAPPSGWVLVEDRDAQKTFASGDWRVRVYGDLPGTWWVNGKGCAEPDVLPPPA